MSKQKMRRLTVELPESAVEFLERHARANRLTVSEVIRQYVELLQTVRENMPLRGLRSISGIVPPDIPILENYYRHILDRYR
ncbi:MAG: ribbon-helix-helix protein, CopG family [Calditrichaeota bacterium]|nr:MAG: ribbon-helix-helix protein, CopG family [Calditrichota bacterium]